MLKKYSLLTKRNFTKGNNKQNKWIVIHYTANNGDTAIANCKYFESVYRGASANWFVDEKSAWLCVKEEDTAWHVGSTKGYYNSCRNYNSVGIELCSRKDEYGRYYFLDETVKNAQELTKELMKKYNIDIDHVVRHYDVTHKICPRPFVENEIAWQVFKQGLIEEEEEMVYNTIEELPSYAVPTIQKLVDKGYLKGNEKGLDINETMVRLLVILDRAGNFDK